MEYFSVISVAHKDLPLNPYVRICLAHSPDYYEIVEGRIVFGHQLRGEQEIDEAISWLIEDLDKVRKKAKRDLKKAQKNKLKTLPSSGIKSEV